MPEKALEVPSFVAGMHLVSDHADVTAALRSPSLRSSRNEYGALFMGGTLAAIDGGEHSERRRLEFPAFSGPALRKYEKQTLLPLLEQYFAECRERRGPDGTFRTDLVDAGLYLLIRIAAGIAGIDGIVTEADARQLLRYVDAHATGGALEWSKLPPEQHERITQECLALRNEFEQLIFTPSLQRRRELVAAMREGRLSAEEMPRDILTELVLGWHDEWDPQLPLRETCMYLTASIRTSTRILTNVTYELARWFESHPADRTLLEDIGSMRNAVGETLRLHPVLPAMIRKCTDELRLPSGDVITAGSSVALLFSRANRDTNVFGPDAGSFDPHRQGRLPSGVPVYGLAFGGGAHTCMGRRLAYGGSYSGDDGQDTLGTVNTLVQAFAHAGVQLDSNDPPTPNEASFYDEFVRFPVVLTNL